MWPTSIAGTMRRYRAAILVLACLVLCAEHTQHVDAFAGTAATSTNSPTKIAPTPKWDELTQSLDELTANENSEAPKVTLYRDTNGWCPFCERIWLILRAKGIPYDEQLISLQNKPSWYKALVPTTLVPAVLIHGDDSTNERRIVWESADILRALDEEFPDTPRMMHEDDANFQAALQMNEELQSAGLAFVYGGRNASLTEEDKMDRRTNFLGELDRLEAALREQGNGYFRLGKEFTAIDAIMVPTLERWRYQLPITTDIDILEGRPGLVSWFKAMDAYEPYAGRVRGDRYSWVATNSMFLRYFGGGEDKPDIAAAIKRADETAETLSASFAEAMVTDEAGKHALEAATKLITNHEAVVADCTRSDPLSQQHIGRGGDVDAADLVLRSVAAALLESCNSSEPIVADANLDAVLEMGSATRRDAALAAKTVASRLCVPRDMSANAASVLRGTLAGIADRLEA